MNFLFVTSFQSKAISFQRSMSALPFLTILHEKTKSPRTVLKKITIRHHTVSGNSKLISSLKSLHALCQCFGGLNAGKCWSDRAGWTDRRLSGRTDKWVVQLTRLRPPPALRMLVAVVVDVGCVLRKIYLFWENPSLIINQFTFIT